MRGSPSSEVLSRPTWPLTCTQQSLGAFPIPGGGAAVGETRVAQAGSACCEQRGRVAAAGRAGRAAEPPSPPEWRTHLVEVLLVVAAQQEEEVDTGPVQRRVPAQLREEPPQLPHAQGRVRSAEQQLRERRATCLSCLSLPAAQPLDRATIQAARERPGVPPTPPCPTARCRSWC